MPRENGDFFSDLRNEIGAKQQNRTSYIRMKLSFLIGLFGIGSLSFAGSSTKPMLYLIPIVVVIFDLYIIGEDFAIRRAGMFLRINPEVPDEEKRWERIVFINRNPVGGLAALISSIFVLIPAVIALWNPDGNSIFYWAWVAASVVITTATWTYSRYLLNKLRRLNRVLKKEFPGAVANT